jgi:hypothetical protein
MNNPLFKMAGPGPTNHPSIHSSGNGYLGAMHGVGQSTLTQGIGGNAIGASNLPPKRKQSSNIFTATPT